MRIRSFALLNGLSAYFARLFFFLQRWSSYPLTFLISISESFVLFCFIWTSLLAWCYMNSLFVFSVLIAYTSLIRFLHILPEFFICSYSRKSFNACTHLVHIFHSSYNSHHPLLLFQDTLSRTVSPCFCDTNATVAYSYPCNVLATPWFWILLNLKSCPRDKFEAHHK